MRTIKFRAWDIENNKWFEDGFSIDQDGKDIYDADENIYPIGTSIHINQFTGLLDSNNRDIFEGDIISTKNYGITQVGYINASFCIYKPSGIKLTLGTKIASSCKIIGNVFENTGLLC